MAKPDFNVFTVKKAEGKDDFWLKIGAAYAHGDNEGFNIVLDAFPPDNKLVLRTYKEKEEAAAPPDSTKGKPADKK